MKSFYERYWEHQDILEDFPYKWPVIKHFIPKEKGLKILDFGCGKGTIFKEILKINSHSEIIGVDVSEKALIENKKRFPKNKFYLIEDGGKLPFNNNFFDFIIASDVLEHVYDTDNAFQELARVLKPNGTILISVPYNGWVKNVLVAMFFFEYIFHPRSPHIRHYTKRNLTNFLKDVKLKPEKIGYYGRFYPVSSGMYILSKKEIRKPYSSY